MFSAYLMWLSWSVLEVVHCIKYSWYTDHQLYIEYSGWVGVPLGPVHDDQCTGTTVNVSSTVTYAHARWLYWECLLSVLVH